jgi:hypothetical protein
VESHSLSKFQPRICRPGQQTFTTCLSSLVAPGLPSSDPTTAGSPSTRDVVMVFCATINCGCFAFCASTGAGNICGLLRHCVDHLEVTPSLIDERCAMMDRNSIRKVWSLSFCFVLPLIQNIRCFSLLLTCMYVDIF